MEVSPQPPLSKDTAAPRPRKPVWSCCLVTIVGLAVLVGLVFLLRAWHRGVLFREAKERMDREFANIKGGGCTQLTNPDPRFLDELEAIVQEYPEGAAKVTELHLYMGRVFDERFAHLACLPNLSKMYLYEISGADAFLEHFRGKPSVTDVSLCETGISDEGIRAIASLPNLKRLHLDYFCKGVSLEPLRGHASLREIELDEVEISPEWAAVLTTIPNLRIKKEK